MTADQQPLESQAPQRTDYQRAAAALLHQCRQDTLGWNSVMAEADPAGPMSALILAIGEIAGRAPEPLASPQGMAGLQAVAQGMALDDSDPLAALDHITLAIRNFYDSGNVAYIRSALAILAVFLYRFGRYEPAATIAGFASQAHRNGGNPRDHRRDQPHPRRPR